jgi:glucose/arabinose dehydrogenase
MSDDRTNSRDRLQRRALIGAAAGGLVAALAPLGDNPAQGVVVTPDPIPARIAKGGLRLALADFCTPPTNRTARPKALLNYLYHAGDGSGRVFVADSRGKLWAISPSGTASLFLDLVPIRGGSIYIETSTKYLGLRTFAFHPDFAKSGRPGFRRFYTVNTEVPARPAGVPVLADPTIPVLYHDVLAEWQVDAAGKSIPGSRREVVRVSQWNRGHNTDQILFKPGLAPGAADYGLMYISVGDGKNNPPHTDPYDQAQNPKSPLGKILRINPLQRGTRSYTVPPSNPFAGNAAWLPEVWALGLRHPEFLSFDTRSGRLIIGHVGQDQIEAIYLGKAGANYGWPDREGTFVTNRFNEIQLSTLPADDASFGYTYPVAQYDHDDGVALCGGFVYRGTSIPALVGRYLFGDIVSGRVFSVPLGSLREGSLATIKEISLLRGGKAVTLRGLLGTTGRVDLRFGQDQAGEMYLMTKQDGIIRKLAPG